MQWLLFLVTSYFHSTFITYPTLFMILFINGKTLIWGTYCVAILDVKIYLTLLKHIHLYTSSVSLFCTCGMYVIIYMNTPWCILNHESLHTTLLHSVLHKNFTWRLSTINDDRCQHVPLWLEGHCEELSHSLTHSTIVQHWQVVQDCRLSWFWGGCIATINGKIHFLCLLRKTWL